jgi:hypothetical protein
MSTATMLFEQNGRPSARRMPSGAIARAVRPVLAETSVSTHVYPAGASIPITDGRPGASPRAVDRVLAAVSDARWDFRTLRGIADASGLRDFEVQSVLQSHPELFRRSLVPDRKGHSLYTLRSKPIKFRERLAAVGKILAGGPR